jgi:dTDP-glucose 4,6-dehydratase
VPTCLVTGGAGFLGSHLCDELLAREHRVICADSLETGSLANIEHIRDPERFRHVNVDIIEPYEIDEPIDFVYHLASPASPIDYLRLPLHTLKVGSYGTHHTLGLAKVKRARFLLASTSEVYGDPLEHPQRETYWGNVNPVGPRSVYDEAKRFAEALTMGHHRALGSDVCIARIFNTYGPRLRPDDGRVVSNFLVQAMRNEPVTVYGGGSQTRSLCFVEDEVRGLVALFDSDLTGPINIGNPDEYTILELATSIVELLGSSSPIVHLPLPTDDPTRRRPDITLARSALGWEPTTPLRDGLARTAAVLAEDLGVAVPALTAEAPSFQARRV